jgi:hypothetical protein
MGSEEMVEEAFVDVFCDLIYGGGWMDIERGEELDRECNWAMVSELVLDGVPLRLVSLSRVCMIPMNDYVRLSLNRFLTNGRRLLEVLIHERPRLYYFSKNSFRSSTDSSLRRETPGVVGSPPCFRHLTSRSSGNRPRPSTAVRMS